MSAPEDERCVFCRRTLAEVEKEIEQRSEFVKVDGEIFTDITVCELCHDIIGAIVVKTAQEIISDRFGDMEEAIKQILGRVLVQAGKIMTGELKVEKKSAPIRVEKIADEDDEEMPAIVGEGEKDEDDEEEEDEDEEDEDSGKKKKKRSKDEDEDEDEDDEKGDD